MDVPQTYKTAAFCNIIGGAFNLIVNLIWSLSLVASCVGAIVLPLPLIAIAVGIWQIVVGMKMNGGERVPNATIVSIVGAATGLFSLSWLSMGLGVFAYLQLQTDEAKGYLEG